MTKFDEYDPRIPEDLAGQAYVDAYRKLQLAHQQGAEQSPPEFTINSSSRKRNRATSVLPIRAHKSHKKSIERKTRREQLKNRPTEQEEAARQAALEQLVAVNNRYERKLSEDGRTLAEIGHDLKQGMRTVSRKVNNFLDDDTPTLKQDVQETKERLHRFATNTGHKLKQAPGEFIEDAHQGVRDIQPKKVVRRLWQETSPFREVTERGLQSFEQMGNRDIGLERSPYEDVEYITSAGTRSRFQPDRAPVFHRPKSGRPGNLRRSGIGSGVGILGTGLNFGYSTNPSGGIGKSYRDTGLTYSTQPQRPPSQRSPLFGNFHHISSGNFGSLEYGAPKQYPDGEQNLQMQQPTQASTPPEPPQRNNYGDLSAFSSVFGTGNQLASNSIYTSNMSTITGGSFGQLRYRSPKEKPVRGENGSPYVANESFLSGMGVPMGDRYRSHEPAIPEQVPQSENKIIQNEFFPTQEYVMPKKTRSANRNTIRPFTNRSQGGAGLPPIPYEIRAKFPMLRNQYPQIQPLTDDEIWIYLLNLRQQQMQAALHRPGISGAEFWYSE